MAIQEQSIGNSNAKGFSNMKDTMLNTLFEQHNIRMSGGITDLNVINEQYEQDLMRKNIEEKKLLQNEERKERMVDMPGMNLVMTEEEFLAMQKRKKVAKNGRFKVERMKPKDTSIMHMVKQDLTKEIIGKRTQEHIKQQHIERQLKNREYQKLKQDIMMQEQIMARKDLKLTKADAVTNDRKEQKNKEDVSEAYGVVGAAGKAPRKQKLDDSILSTCAETKPMKNP